MNAEALTDHDEKHLRKTWRQLQEPCDSPDCSAGDCDCHSSETVMTSQGYVEVWADGDVVGYGGTVINVGD